MNVAQILREIDQQISKLQHARDVLASLDSTTTTNRPRRRRKMSAESRAKIAAAARARWAKRKGKS